MTTESWLHDDATVKFALRDKYVAEAEKARRDAEASAVNIELARLHLAESRDRHDFYQAADLENHVYRFRGSVSYEAVTACIEHLTRWSRLAPGADITLILNTPGGYVTEGMDLFDTIMELREKGHRFTGIGRGYVASMGSVLLQACDWRVMGPGCAMLLHEPSGMALGSLGEIEDAAGWLKMTADRMLDVYAERCASSAAEKPFSRSQLKAGWNRKDWWLTATRCLEGGLIDEIR